MLFTEMMVVEVRGMLTMNRGFVRRGNAPGCWGAETMTNILSDIDRGIFMTGTIEDPPKHHQPSSLTSLSALYALAFSENKLLD